MNRTDTALGWVMTFTLGDDVALLQPITLGETAAANRVFMAPLAPLAPIAVSRGLDLLPS